MRFIIQRDALNELVNKLQSIIPAKPTLPILANLFIEAKNNELTIIASDLTVGIRTFIQAEVIEEGITTIPAKKFFQILRELISPHVEISTNANQVTTIKSGGARFRLNGIEASLFPDLPNLENAFSFTIAQKELKTLLSSVAFAVSKDENRHVLMGVLMKIKNSEVHFYGTDGKRLARSFFKLEIDPSYKSESIIPIKAVEEIIKSLKEEGEAKVSILADKLGLEFNQTEMITKLLAGEYPDLNPLLEQKEVFSVILHKEEFSSLLRQVALFVEDTSHSARFIFNEGELELNANKPTIGEGNTTMVANYHGQKFEIAFNPIFFLDILRQCHKETVTLNLVDSYNPGIIKDGNKNEEGKEQEGKAISSVYLLMPMRLTEE